ncbi:MAG: alpha/beta hydrolase, partial [Acidiferrobacterales bacterium]
MDPLDPPIEIQTGSDPVASVIWLHGLGADGHDFEAIVPELKLPESLAIRFVFPNAPMRSITINGGMVMRGWYDIMPDENGFRENNDDIQDASAAIRSLIEREQERGIPASRIILAGFSQGGAVALYTGLGLDEPLAGIMVLSAYVPMIDSVDSWMSVSTKSVPVFQAHGQLDPLVALSRAEKSLSVLKQQGLQVEWH